MSDFPYVGPPPGGLTAAMTTARRRRFRSASTTSGLSAMSLLVVALLAGQSGRTNLVQGPTTEVPAVTTDDREASTHQRTEVTLEAGERTTFTLGAAPGVAPASPGAVAPAVPAGPLAAGPKSRQETTTLPGRRDYAAGPIERSDTQLAVTQCVVGGDGKSATVCPSVYVGSSSSSAAPYRLSADVCSSEPNPVFLRYRGTSEVDFLVLDPKGREVWRWSQWHPRGSGAHTLTLETGYCKTWTFDWTGVDSSGAALPKADGYRLQARFHADELASRQVADAEFTLT